MYSVLHLLKAACYRHTRSWSSPYEDSPSLIAGGWTKVAVGGEISELLRAAKNGEKQAEDKLIHLIYPELRRLARHRMRRERTDHTLQTTALVHEAYLRLITQPDRTWECRRQFFAIAANLMRQVLIDHARARLRQKRGGGQVKTCLDERFAGVDLRRIDVIELDECLSRLTKIDQRQGQIVEMRFFAGLSVEEVAQHLGISSKTVRRDWEAARAWLFRAMRRPDGIVGRRVGEGKEPV
jgi:RNA polymerase sigma factor (TIGR02999 family)